MQVSCGTFHSAAISAAGVLYTWGDGLFGKLGHGGSASRRTPGAVEALSDSWVSSVAAGTWHTAAVVLPRQAAERARSGTPASPTPGSVGAPRPATHVLGGWGGGAMQVWGEPLQCAIV